MAEIRLRGNRNEEAEDQVEDREPADDEDEDERSDGESGTIVLLLGPAIIDRLDDIADRTGLKRGQVARLALMYFDEGDIPVQILEAAAILNPPKPKKKARKSKGE